MIIEGLFSLIFVFVEFVMNLIPSFDLTALDHVSASVMLLANGLVLFPVDLWVVLFTNIVFWLSTAVLWSVIEWVYKKIPGLD